MATRVQIMTEFENCSLLIWLDLVFSFVSWLLALEVEHVLETDVRETWEL